MAPRFQTCQVGFVGINCPATCTTGKITVAWEDPHLYRRQSQQGHGGSPKGGQCRWPSPRHNGSSSVLRSSSQSLWVLQSGPAFMALLARSSCGRLNFLSWMRVDKSVRKVVDTGNDTRRTALLEHDGAVIGQALKGTWTMSASCAFGHGRLAWPGSGPICCRAPRNGSSSCNQSWRMSISDLFHVSHCSPTHVPCTAGVS